MIEPILIFLACFAPSLAWLGYFYLKDKYEPEPLHLLLMVFGGGLLAGPVSLLLFRLIELVPFYRDLPYIGQVSDFQALLYCFFAIGPIEELSKFLVFWFFVDRRHIVLDAPIDGLIYAAAAALGFATIENWYFMLSAEGAVWSRAIALPFNHVLFASFWGAALGIVRYSNLSNRLVYMGLGLSMVYHGLYDYILFADSVPNTAAAPLILVLWLWVSLVSRELLRRSPLYPVESVSEET